MSKQWARVCRDNFPRPRSAYSASSVNWAAAICKLAHALPGGRSLGGGYSTARGPEVSIGPKSPGGSIMLSRREFLAAAGSLAVTAGSGSAYAAMGPNDKFALLIKGGDVLDPSQSLRGRRDIGIRYGVIEAVEADIPEARGLRVLNVSGKLVTPGLIDLHSHVYPYGSAIGLPADELVPHQCTTTCVSAGDAGSFRRHIVAQSRTRLYAFVH